ncbi:MAG: YedE family putative selenium transporter [Bacillota bacterium]|jgi:YedE family putative selenium metabolism protein
MSFFSSRAGIIFSGLLVGVMAVFLVIMGNPANMGACIACFYRDAAGALGLHQAATVQYMRPEILGILLGAFITSLVVREFKPQGGSSTILRFFIAVMVMFGALVFLGCPLRMILRLGGGDLNAFIALIGFIAGILTGIYFLKNGFTLGRAYNQSAITGSVLPFIFLVFLILAGGAAIFLTSAEGPGSLHAPFLISLIVGLLIGFLAQKTRLCIAGGIRDAFLIRDFHLVSGFLAILIGTMVMNLIFGKFKLGFVEQPIAHTSHLWNFLGLYVVGLGSIFLGGCPLRQTVLAGQGNVDSAVTIIGFIVGAALSHNFGIAGSPKGVGMAGQYIVVISIVLLFVIGFMNSRFGPAFNNSQKQASIKGIGQ